MGVGYHLNPYEQLTLQSIVAALGHPGTADLAQLGLSTVQGAEQRRTTNLQTRESGLQALQQSAMDLAAHGASEQAILDATMGQANQLPMMNGPAGQRGLGDLASFVGGLDWQQTPQGPISGLAPADYRAQFQPTSTDLLSPDIKTALGTLVVQNLQAGVPFVDIREKARQAAIANGADPATVAAAVSTAEQMYQSATGMDLASMRSMGDELRGMQSTDPNQLASLFSAYHLPLPSPIQGSPYQAFGPQVGAQDVNVQQLLGAIAAQRGGLSGLQGALTSNDQLAQQILHYQG